MRRTRPSTFRATVAVLAALAMGAFAGCGSDDEGSGGGGDAKKTLSLIHI